MSSKNPEQQKCSLPQKIAGVISSCEHMPTTDIYTVLCELTATLSHRLRQEEHGTDLAGHLRFSKKARQLVGALNEDALFVLRDSTPEVVAMNQMLTSNRVRINDIIAGVLDGETLLWTFGPNELGGFESREILELAIRDLRKAWKGVVDVDYKRCGEGNATLEVSFSSPKNEC